MKLRRSILILLFYLALFFSLDQTTFGIGSDPLVDLEPFVFPLTIGLIIATIAIQRVWALPPMLLVGAGATGYLGFKTLLFDAGLLVDGNQTYVTITELIMVALGVSLAHVVATHLHEVEEVVANITFSDLNPAVKPLKEASEDVQREMLRSRRYGRPLSVIVVEPDPASIDAEQHETVTQIQKSMITPYVVASLARIVGQELRRTDLVLDHHERRRFIAVCPETSGTDSATLAERIRTAAERRLGVHVTSGVASFPNDALSFEELVNRAETKLRLPQQPEEAHEILRFSSAEVEEGV